ncbi:Rha family transcriptional regulator [Cytobacillus oceanisediminis]|uniref:Rha family transcriptional regulator n=1 Tax=Cytobacillus oceanisediminis TaxID=665099 RepID=UPI00207A6737|nr:Rha family transcriptional regulator [Cytobacillus oceanisediminis]USK43564.1 Rha family transcriptional regulator [Cytobacillus oceanisediminis]
MNQLVFIENNKAVTDSLTVAEVFGKRHDSVIRDIENQVEKLNQAGEKEFSLHNFVESTYSNERGRQYRKVNLSEDAFTLVAMSYVTPEAMKMKVKFIQEFKKMREQIENNKVKVLDDRTAFIKSLQLTAETAERQDEMQKVLLQHNQKIHEIEHKVEEQITLTSGEQRRLQKGIAQKVYDLEDVDRDVQRKLFRELHREIKDRFGVASYKDVKRKELQSALRYIENWIPRKVS